MAEVPKLDEGKTIRVSEQLTVHLVEKSRYGITLLLATGSAPHVDGLRALAATKGLRLDGQGLRRGRKIVGAKEEEDIYAALGLPLIAPELREGQGEIQRALKRKLPKLVSDKDICGILHAHTDLSDGVDTLDAMAEATCSRGYVYFGIAESAHYAGPSRRSLSSMRPLTG